MNQETKKTDTATQAESTQKPESLLQEFGGAHKPAPVTESTAPTEPVAAKKTTEKDAPAPTSKSAAPRKSADEKKTSPKSEVKKEKNTEKAAKESKKTAKEKKPEKDTVRASTGATEKAKPQKAAEGTKKASSAASKKKTSEQARTDLPRRSASALHQVLPYVFIVLAVFLGVTLFLNLACNKGNQLEGTPASHWMGVVGYYICYGLFGIFGPAVFVLPFLLLNLGFFWKKYIDNRLAFSKVAASLLFLVLLAVLIHIFSVHTLPADHRQLSSAELMTYGAKMTGGGWIGGHVGYWLYSILNMVGSLLLTLCLLVASLFYCIGMTPQQVWSMIRMRRAMRKKKELSPSEQNAEMAKNRAEMDEKIRKTLTRQPNVGDPNQAPDGAVEIVGAALRKKREDKLAPIPIPDLSPNDGSVPFVPTEVSRKLSEEEQAREEAEKAKAAEEAEKAKLEAEKAAKAAASIEIARNHDAAVDPIFPKNTENRQVRRVPKEDRNFDLKNVFIDLDDGEKPVLRKHAELPPEAPLSSGVRKPAAAPATKAPGAPAPRPATAAKPATTAGTTPRPATAAKPAAPGEKPVATGQKPVFRKSANAESKEFGLSNEEFEKLETANKIPAKVGASKPGTTAKPVTKTAPTKAAPTVGGKLASPKTTTSMGKIASAENPVAPAKGKGDASTPASFKSTTKKYVFPPISYLHPAVPMTAENRAEIEESMNQLAETLANFHVSIKEIDYACGPTATRYEVFPAPGVRVRSFVNLADDISLALAAGGIRIEAPIPGKSAVGIEVPNKNRCTVYLRELLESKQFTEASSKLTACLGADITGKPLLFDIAKMPHLLVAGTTGSGKSVCINCTIMSLLYKAKPDEVKLVLIDPKKVEFSIYKNIPHLMAPIVTTPKDAAGALQAAVEEMERRFELFEQVSVHDLKGYNEITKNDPDMPFLPQIVIIIDELADLMMTAPDEVETAICRIAQKARAAGMHLIVGTQRPSVDVVTGLIKSNIPSRIAFTVASQVDSKTILDYAGAEKLAGRGDMLFAPIGALKPARVQGAYVDDKEVEKICEFLRATNGTAQYDEKFISKLKELAAQCGNKGKGGGGGGSSLPSGSDSKDGDNKYADAVRIAIEEKRVSTSLLQRKLEIGYSRAAKIIDRMQEEGIVSPPDGSKPRAILITPEEYMDRFMNGDGDKEEG